jgi:hypothetical protein
VVSDPTEAITTKTTATISLKARCSCKKISAQIEAAAGSRLIKILNVRAGSWPSAFISNVKVWHWTEGKCYSKERNVGVRLLNPFPIIPKAQLMGSKEHSSCNSLSVFHYFETSQDDIKAQAPPTKQIRL